MAMIKMVQYKVIMLDWVSIVIAQQVGPFENWWEILH